MNKKYFNRLKQKITDLRRQLITAEVFRDKFNVELGT